MKKQSTKRKDFNIVWSLMLLLTAVLFAFILIGPRHFETNTEEETQTELSMSVPSAITPTPTELPEKFQYIIPDYFENENRTDGIIWGAAVILFIILIGIFISKRNNEK